MDFSNILIRCSSLSKIMADPVGGRPMSEAQISRMNILEERHTAAGNGDDKPLTDKMLVELADLREKYNNPEEPELALVCKKELIDIYLFEKFSLRSLDKDKMIMYTEKGKMVEEEAIQMLSEQDETIYIKNTERKSNDWISGETDIIPSGKIIDIKASWDAESFMLKILSPLDKTYWWQMQGYMALWDLDEAEVCYCLVDTPETLINDEKRRLFYSMGVTTEEDPVYEMLAGAIDHNMRFSWIDASLRIMRFKVQRDRSAMLQVYTRVEKCRKWLQLLHETHEKFRKVAV